MRAEYDGQTLVILRDLYQRILRCNINNNKSLKKCEKNMTNTNNKLVKLNERFIKTYMFCSFLD